MKMIDKCIFYRDSIEDVVTEIKKISLKKAGQASEVPEKNSETKG